MDAKILIVDDDSQILEAMAVALRRHFAVSVAPGGREGLDRLRTRGPFAVAVADYKMPGMDGVEFLFRLRRLAPETVRIMLTGHGDLDAAMAAVNRGEVFRFLTKPCPTPLLREALGQAVEKYQRERRDGQDATPLPAVDRPPGAPVQEAAPLTPRERHIARMIRRGEGTKQIAAALHISPRTVETYRDNIRKKLGLANKKINLQGYLTDHFL